MRGKDISAALLVCLTSFACSASAMSEAAPGGSGFHSDHSRFDFSEVDAILQADVATGALPFAEVAVFAGDERVYYARAGYTNKNRKEELKRGSLYRIASLSKALTSFAALRVIESGALGLDDPVARYIPEFDHLSVQTPCPDNAADSALAPCARRAERTMIIRHLMAHTAGISYPLIGVDKVTDAYAAAGMTNGAVETPYSLAELPERIARLPLANEPGAGWRYGLATDVLGRVLEVATGKPLPDILEEEVFALLDMNETGFTVAAEDQSRLVPIFQKSESGELIAVPRGRVVADPFVFSTTYPFETEPRYYSGGGGLVSSLEDLSKFVRMLAQNGVHGGERLLGEGLMAEFVRDQTQPFGTGIPAVGFGLGIGVRLAQKAPETRDGAGELFWSGIFFTTFWADLDTDLSGVFLSQMRPDQRPKTAERIKDAITRATSR
jgi:CubicO group peptidase (beta-lactamase class C family)